MLQTSQEDSMKIPPNTPEIFTMAAKLHPKTHRKQDVLLFSFKSLWASLPNIADGSSKIRTENWPVGSAMPRS